MKYIKEIVFIIHARLASTRIHHKMIKPFANTTLLDIAINKVLSSNIIPKENIYLSTYDQPLIDIGKKYNLNIFKRSEESSINETNIKLLFEWHDKLEYTYFVRINSCLPLLSVSTIDNFVKHFLSTKNEGLFGVIRRENYIWDKNGKPINIYTKGSCFNTRFVEPFFEAAHCLYAGRMDKIKKGIDMGTFKKKNYPELFQISERESFDINYPWQFEICEILYKNLYQNETVLS